MPTRTLRLSDQDDAILRHAAAGLGCSVHERIVIAIRGDIQRQASRKDGAALAAEIKRVGWTTEAS